MNVFITGLVASSIEPHRRVFEIAFLNVAKALHQLAEHGPSQDSPSSIRNRRTVFLSLGLAAAGALTVWLLTSGNCYLRSWLASTKQCVSDSSTGFDVFEAGRGVVERLCGNDYDRLSSLRAAGGWVDGHLDTTATGAKAEYVVANSKGETCTIAVTQAMAERVPSRSEVLTTKPWPHCTTAEVWREATALGYRVPKEVELAYDRDGLRLVLRDGEWMLDVNEACPKDWRLFSGDAHLAFPSELATEVLQATVAGQTHDLPQSAAASKKGCRSPAVTRCAECCLPLGDGCARFGRRTDGAPTSYTRFNRSESPCPSACPRCATCSEFDERQLRAYSTRAECDCQGQTAPDPCFDVTSCGCYCKHLAPLIAACPGDMLIEKRGK